MNTARIHDYALEKLYTELTHPFGNDVDVYKVMNKMFALASVHQQRPIVNLKCDPEQASALCDIHADIIPGYHMDKRHWITVFLDGAVPTGEVQRLIDQSYELVVAKLPKRDQRLINPE